MYFPKLDKIAWFLKKYETYFILLFLVIIGTILWKFNYLTEFTGEWTSCVDYIKEGILYKGQPRCYHGPVNFLISYILIEFFPNNFLQLYELLVLISSILLFFLIYKIIRKLNLKPHYPLLSVLFFILIYVNPINNNSGDSIYSTLIMLYGFYVLYFSKNEYYKYLFSSLIFTIATFTRLNVIIPIFLVLVYYFINNFFSVKDKKIIIDYRNLAKALILMIILPITVVIILKLIFPNIIAYSILTQLIVEDYSLLLKLKEFFSGISLLTKLTFLIPALLIPLSWFYKKRDVYSFIALFGFILITYGTLRGHYGYFHRYYIAIFPFLIVTIIEILNNIKSNYKKIIFIIIILIFSLSSLKISDPYLTSPEFHKLRNIVDGGFEVLPDLPGRILADNDYFLKFANIDPKKVDIVSNKYGIDGMGALRIESLGLLDSSWKDWRIMVALSNLQFKEVDIIGKKILNNTYNIIVMGPQGGEGMGTSSPITQIMGFYALRFFNKPLIKFPYNDDFKIYCNINFPTLMNPCPNCNKGSSIFFKNITKENCENINYKLYSYLYSNLYKICDLDQETSIELARGMNLNNYKCSSNKHLLKKLYERKVATFKEGLLITLIIFILLVYYYLTTKKSNPSAL